MVLNTFLKYRNLIIDIIFLPILFLLLDGNAYTQEKDNPKIKNADWTVIGNIVTITYDLEATESESYDIGLILLKENNPSFNLIPKTVDGDYGEVLYIKNPHMKIRWEYKKDFPEGLAGEGYYFKITIDKTGSSWWWWIILPTLTIGGIYYFNKDKLKSIKF